MGNFSAAIGDRFNILGEVGRGGYGAIFKAYDESSGRLVALKILHEPVRNLARFEREAALLATLRHPNVVGYLGHGQTADGNPYLAMAWLEGHDLGVRLKAGPLPIEEALAIALGAAKGLGAAHARGIVHRDVKPSNLFLVGAVAAEAGDRVRLLDFGIARLEGADPIHLTTTGALLGTPAYMAPEQARAGGVLSPRTDVYALGAVLYHAVAGGPPFADPNPLVILGRLLTAEPPRLSERRPDVPPVLEALLDRMLTTDPGDRFADGDAVAMAIADALSSAAVPARGASRAAVSSLWAQPRAVLVGVDSRGDWPAGAEAILSTWGGETTIAEPQRPVAIFSHPTLAGALERAARTALELRARDATWRLFITGEVGTDRTVLLARALALAEEQVTLGAGLIGMDPGVIRHLTGTFVCQVGDRRATLLGRRPSSGSIGTLIGRTAEIGRLEAAFGAVVEEMGASLVSITGEPGIGKSRLMTEIARRLSAHAARPVIFSAAADRVGVAAPFALAAGLVHSWLGDRADQTPEEAGIVSAESDLLRRSIGPNDDANPAVDPAALADRYRLAFLALAEALLRRGSVAILVDDLQWADPSSMNLLASALEEFADRPLFVLAAARLDGRGDPLGPLAGYHPERIVLQPLRPRAAAEIVRTELPDADVAKIDRIVAAGGGNPLWIREFCRSSDEVTGARSLPDAIAARFGRLPPGVQRVLRAGSVFGRQFLLDGVAILLGGPARRADAADALADAVQERLIEVDGVDRFAFTEPLIQEHAYAALPESERTQAHGTVARWLAERRGAIPSLLAWHFERSAAPAEAVRWYEAAARLALGASDAERARVLIDKAVALTPIGEPRARVLTLAGEAAFAIGDAVRAAALANEAIALAVRGGATAMAAMGLAITSAGQLGENQKVRLLIDEVRATPATPDAAVARVLCICRAASQLFHAGDRLTAKALTAEAEQAALDDPRIQAWLLRLKASFLSQTRTFEQAANACAESAAFMVAAGDMRGACQMRMFQGSALIFAADFDAAQAQLDVADAIARRIGASFLRWWTAYTRSKALALAGHPADARAHLEKVRRAVPQHPRIVAGTWTYSAIAALRAQDAEWAESAARAAMAAHPAPASRAAALGALGRALVLAGRPDEALVAAREAHTLVAETGPLEENQALVTLAEMEALLATNHPEAAAAIAGRAVAGLLEDAAQLSTPARREAYLHGVEIHATTLSLARQLGIAPASHA